MNSATKQLIVRMLAAQRPELLRFLVSVISEITVFGRSYYGARDEIARLSQANEAIHHVAGHLRDLWNPNEAFTENRAQAIVEELELLHPRFPASIPGLHRLRGT
jgi:hypothetical protein